MYYLSSSEMQRFEYCQMRKFDIGEHHITRVFNISVLILMFDGILRFTEDGRDIELRRGEYYIQRQGLYQEGRYASDVPEYFYIHFNGSFTKDNTGVPIRGKFCIADVINEIKKLERTFFSSSENTFSLNGTFYNILGCLNSPLADSDIKTDVIKEIEKYMWKHFTDNSFSLRDIKNKFCFSEDYIIKIFKTAFKKTPHRYITSLRIKYAQKLMLSSGLTLGNIAAECGYNDYSVFYKNFIHETGLSPQEWMNSPYV